MAVCLTVFHGCARALEIGVDLESGRDLVAELWDFDNEDTNREGQVLSASDVPDKPSSTVTLRSGTYDFDGRTIDGSGVGSGSALFSCNKQSGVTFKDVKIVGNPRYGLFIRSCNGISISDVTMDEIAVGGIRFDKGYETTDVTIGKIRADNVGGHAVELWDVDGYSISKVTAKKTDGCGLLLNRCKDGTVGTVDGDKNDQNGGYATLRFANENGKVTVSKVKSRNSGRGVFSVSDSEDATVKDVDISGTNKDGIYIQDSKNTKVNDGKSRGSPNCRIRGGSGNSLSGVDCGGSISS